MSDTRVPQLEAFLSNRYGYPAAVELSDAEKEALLRAAGRGADWENYAQLVNILRLLEAQQVPDAALQAQRDAIASREAEWNTTVFSGHRQPASGITAACRGRSDYSADSTRCGCRSST